MRPEDEWLDLLPDRGTAYNEAQILARLDAGAPLPEAFFCAHDLLAITLLKAFRQRNIRVPEDVALIGVDYNPMGQIIEPRLTSIDVCCRAQAEAAVRRLIECIESGEMCIRDRSSTAIGTVIALAALVFALGALIRYLTRNELLAYGVCLVLTGIICVIGFVDSAMFEGLLPAIMRQLSLFERLNTFVSGVFDLSAVVYDLSVTAFFLFLSVQSLEKRRYN